MPEAEGSIAQAAQKTTPEQPTSCLRETRVRARVWTQSMTGAAITSAAAYSDEIRTRERSRCRRMAPSTTPTQYT